jgi:hypothetical protein
MDKIILGLGHIVLLALVMCFGAVLSGTILCFIWPVVAPVFHLPDLGWWQSVCLVWACEILIKPTAITSNIGVKKAEDGK